MYKLILSLTMLALPAVAQSMFTTSQLTLAAAQLPDIHSSWNRYELNPVLGRGQFGSRQLTIKLGATGAVLLLQRIPAFRRHRKVFTAANFAASTITLGVAVNNYRR